MDIEITTDVVRLPELDLGAELGFAVAISVQATSADEDASWQALAAQGIDRVGIFAPWRYRNLSLAIGAPGEIPTRAQQITGPAIRAAESIRRQLDALLVERGLLGNTTFALTGADDIDDQDRFAVPRFLAGLAVQPAPFNRVVYQTMLLARAAVTSDDCIATLAFDVAGTSVNHPAGAGADASADGIVARRWDLGVRFEGANLFLRSRVDARQNATWILPTLDHASLYSRQLDTVQGQDPHDAVTATAAPVFISGVATEAQSEGSAGALLFLRTNGPGETRAWRCLSEALSHQTLCLAPSPLALTEVRRDQQTHTHDGVEIAYQGDSLFAASEYTGESDASESDREALLPLVDSDSPWSFEPTLGYGFDVEAALLLVGNAGVLPADLQDPVDPTALRAHIDAGGAAFDPPAHAIASQRYLRRSPVAACLLDTALYTTPAKLSLAPPRPDEDPVLLAEGADLAIHELPPQHFPLKIDREPSTSLLLLDGRAPNRTLILRAPATSYSVLDRWLAADERASGPIDARADYRVAFERLRDLDLEQLPQRERSQLSFCDPAVDSLLIELHEVWPTTRRIDSRRVSLHRAEQHRDLDDGAILVDQTRNSWSEAVILTIELGGELVSVQQAGNRVTIRMPANACAQLRVYAGVERQLWTQRCVADLQPMYAPEGADPDHVWLSPRSLMIESADQSLPAPGDLLQALTLTDDDDDSVTVTYTAPAGPNAGKAKNIREIAVSRQHWRWDGRGVETPPRAAEPDWNRVPQQGDSAETSGVLWETSNYIERLGASPVSELCPVPAGVASLVLHQWPKPHRHEDVVRATFLAHHRYAPQLRVEPLEIGDDDDRYRRLRLPAMAESALTQPALGLMLPLLDGEGESTAGDMLLVLQEPWYQRGLAEGLQVEIEPIARDLCPIDGQGLPTCTEIGGEPRCEITERVARAEIGADPILSADIRVQSGELPPLQVAGPFGLTFDREINNRRQVGTVFTVGGASAFDLAKLRMRRALEPSAFAGYSRAALGRRALSPDEISAFANSGNLILDVYPGQQSPSGLPLTLEIDATRIEIEVHPAQIVISVDGNQVAALARKPLPSRLYRLTLVRQFDLRPDAMPGVWSLRLEALVDHRYLALASAELMLPARADAVTVVAPPGTESAVIVAPRYSRWNQSRWTQFWPRRDHLMPDGARLGLLDQPLHLVHDGGAWQLRNDDGELQPHGLLAEHDDQGHGRRLFHWLLVTRRVQSGAGSIISELPKSILEIVDATSFRAASGAEPLDPDESDLIARVVLVQRSPVASGAASIWERLFPRPNSDGVEVDAELRIIGISRKLTGQ
ncbi:MAG: hypothetical protein KDI60_04870 [Xanthomonadales bacterium]|nr:hypothetical protein [Xanthomonadales bacterium]MCP5476985.1 hypothetical protein [Rhodanobacteraceae bacterium]